MSSGTIAVHQDNTVQIIAEEAIPIEQLDLTVRDTSFHHSTILASLSSMTVARAECVQIAKHNLEKFSNKAASGTETERAEAEIGVEVYAAMVKALEH